MGSEFGSHDGEEAGEGGGTPSAPRVHVNHTNVLRENRFACIDVNTLVPARIGHYFWPFDVRAFSYEEYVRQRDAFASDFESWNKTERKSRAKMDKKLLGKLRRGARKRLQRRISHV